MLRESFYGETLALRPRMDETITVKLKRKELELLRDFLLECLHSWSESGVNKDQQRAFNRLVGITVKLRKALGEDTITII